MNDDVCAVCLEVGPTASLGCGHRLHVHCLINCAQYDVRCPVCRQVDEGVVPKPAAAQHVLVAEEVLDLDAMEREWRRYTNRRRRVLRQRPELGERVRRLRALRSELTKAFEGAQRAYDRKCRDVWRADPEVRARRDELDRLRRRERRLESTVDAELEALLGPEP